MKTKVIYRIRGGHNRYPKSWESKVPLVSHNKALFGPYFLGGVALGGGYLRFPWQNRLAWKKIPIPLANTHTNIKYPPVHEALKEPHLRKTSTSYRHLFINRIRWKAVPFNIHTIASVWVSIYIYVVYFHRFIYIYTFISGTCRVCKTLLYCW